MDNVRESLAGRMRYAAMALAALLMIARPLIMEIAYDGSSLWIAQGWFAVGIMWVLSQVFRRQLVWKFHVLDVLVLALATVVAISALNALALRPAINLAWEWAALSMMFFMMRQCFSKQLTGFQRHRKSLTLHTPSDLGRKIA